MASSIRQDISFREYSISGNKEDFFEGIFSKNQLKFRCYFHGVNFISLKKRSQEVSGFVDQIKFRLHLL